MTLLFSLLPFISTALGGALAIRFRHRLHPVMAFAAGVLVTTALADLLPEAHDYIGHDNEVLIGVAAAAGYLVFSALEALVHQRSLEHLSHGDDHDHPHPALSKRDRAIGLAAPIGLIIHSLLDGLAIGVGFRASQELGLIVGLAVLAHDFADGMNVVTLALGRGNRMRSTVVLLVLDALAPVIGAFTGSVMPVSQLAFGLILAGFAGVFVAIGAGHLLPEAQHGPSGASLKLVLLAAFGAAVVLVIRGMVGGH